MNRLILLFLFIFSLTTMMGQNTSKKKDSTKMMLKERIVFFNMTPMASQFVPFNAIDPFTAGPINLGAKYFVNNVGYRFGVGVNIDFSNGTDQNRFLNIRNGYEKRKNINENWKYTHGCDALLSFGGLNLPGNSQQGGDFLLLAIAPFWGVEYCFNKNFSISTETSLLIGLGTGDFFDESPFRLKFIPPVSLFFNIKH